MNHNDLTNDTLSGDEDPEGLYMNLPNIPFPRKLHELLETVEREGCESIISWLPDRQSFKVHDQKAFSDQILPRYFKLTKYKSFQRQLNIYGFERISDNSSNRGGYSHTYLVRGDPKLCVNMIRQKIKGNGKSRRITTPSSPLPSSSDHSSLSHEHRHQQEATKTIIADDEDSSMAAEEKRMPIRVQSSSDLLDGDLQMFHGKPFHFVNYISSRDQSPPCEIIVQQPKQQMLPANNALVTPFFSKPTCSKTETRAYLKTMLAPYFEVPEHLPRRQSLIFSF
jgi:hypothetical protein